MNFKYQVVVHTGYYPSSILFEDYEPALAYYNDVKGSSMSDEQCTVTLCKIEQIKGNDPIHTEYDWYVSKHSEQYD